MSVQSKLTFWSAADRPAPPKGWLAGRSTRIPEALLNRAIASAGVTSTTFSETFGFSARAGSTTAHRGRAARARKGRRGQRGLVAINTLRWARQRYLL